MAERVHLIRIGYGYAIAGSLPPAAIGEAYSRTLTAIGGVGIKRLEILAENVTDAIVFTDNGDNTATFAMADPQTAGTYSVTVRATDANRQRWTRTFTFQVVALPLSISGSLSNCTVGSAYSDTLTVSGGVQPYSLDSYTLPAGLSAILSGDTITISGTPTGAGLGQGTSFNFATDFSVSDSIAGGVEYEQTITISVSAVVATIDGGALPDATVGVAYSHDIDATGGVGAPYIFSLQSGTLPAGFTLDSSTGALTGTPTTAGTHTLTFRATDSEGNFDDVSDTVDVVAGLLESLSPDPVFVLSIKKLISSATNAIRVRRSSDNAEQDIGFSGTALDTAALASFVGSNSAYVVKFYDQTGNGFDAVQSTSSKQARIVNAGTYDGKAILDGTDDFYTITAPTMGTSYAAIYMGGSMPFSMANNKIIYEHSTNYGTNGQNLLFFRGQSPNVISLNLCNAGGGGSGQKQCYFSINTFHTTKHVYSALYDRTLTGANECKLWVNGSAQSPTQNFTQEGTGNFSTYDAYIGARAGTTLFCDMSIESLVVYNADTSGIRTSIEGFL